MSWNTLDPAIRTIAEQHLTAKQLRVLELRLNGHSFRTIGRSLGINEATVRGHHERALDILAQHINTEAA